MSQTTETFIRLPLDLSRANAIFRVMLQVIGFHYGHDLKDCNDYRYRSKGPLDIAIGPTCGIMPCCVISTHTSTTDYKPLIIIAFSDEGFSIVRFEYPTTETVLSFEEAREDITRCCKEFCRRMIEMVKAYIGEHFPRFVMAF